MKIMGILNVTPDSFSDGGHHFHQESAIFHSDQIVQQGADIIDIGGESTRPFAEPVSLQEELNRVIPVIEAIRSKHQIPISIDTTKAEVARRALDAGADIVNDVSALQQDPAMIDVAADTNCPIIIMHMQGTPGNMQINPEYDDVVEDIIAFFKQRLQWLTGCGIARHRVTLDPGVGFGKNLGHNLSILKHLDRFKSLGQPLLLGHSRKRFLGEVTGRDALDRDLPTAVVTALALHQGVDIARVHNVGASRDALSIATAIRGAI
ncbi:MAG: dihydropteroate synthase [Desulfopila sp.]